MNMNLAKSICIGLLLVSNTYGGLKKHGADKSKSDEANPAEQSKYLAGQRIKTRLYGEVEILRVQDDGVIVKKISTGRDKYDPFLVKKSDFDTLSEKTIPDRELKKMQTVSTKTEAKKSRICLSYASNGTLICTAADPKKVTCPGEKNWRGPGPCNRYAGKKVSDLPKKQWADLIWVYNYEIEKRDAPPIKPGESKVDRCIGKCTEKKCRRESPGTYQESWTSASRCGYFCKQECQNNHDAYR